MVNLTRPQRLAVARIVSRVHGDNPTLAQYRAIRRTVRPGPGCVMIPFAGMWLGIEPDGYTHS